MTAIGSSRHAAPPHDHGRKGAKRTRKRLPRSTVTTQMTPSGHFATARCALRSGVRGPSRHLVDSRLVGGATALTGEIQVARSSCSNPFNFIIDAAVGEERNSISIMAALDCLLLTRIPAVN
jgi:hypothetical protein